MIGIDDPVCGDLTRRRADVRAHPDPLVNGIDFLEVDAADHSILHVFFLKPVPPADPGDPADVDDVYGLRADPSRIQVYGGVRIVGIAVEEVTRQPDGSLVVDLDPRGDFSLYVLEIDVPELDPFLRRTEVDFAAPCPVEFDCRQPQVCPPEDVVEPLLDYQAKDYASFRQLLLDLLPSLNPNFVERNPADLGIAVVELLAYVGDHLSYLQDAVANEAFLDSVRHRISARRHARLVDYRMHDGRNAWTWVHVEVTGAGTLDRGTAVFTHVYEALRGQLAPPGAVIDLDDVKTDDPSLPTTLVALDTDPALANVVAYETTHDARFHPDNNEIFIHSWANEECCLQPGTRELFVYHVNQTNGQASRPPLAKGDYLLLEEVRGPRSGRPADADSAHRQVMRIEDVSVDPINPGDPPQPVDSLYRDRLAADPSDPNRRQLLQPNGGGDPPLPLLRVRFRRRDALAFPACLSVRREGHQDLLRNVTVARGNLVFADHGLTIQDRFGREEFPGRRPLEPGSRFRLALRRGPLTQQCDPETSGDEVSTGLLADRFELDCPAAQARPAVILFATSPSGDDLWTPVPDLFDSPPTAEHFVAEVDNDGRATLRFGDGQYGRDLGGSSALRAVYRIGNGRAGNVGAEALSHVAVAGGPAAASFVAAVRNPLAGGGGVDVETIEEVRRFAPQAFWAKQLRAVTEADYRVLAEQLPEVASAVASFRWTGSWLTVFVGIDPTDPADLIQQGQGLARLSDALAAKVRAALTKLRIAGFDLEIRPPRFVPLEIDLDLCVSREHFRSEVARVVALELSNHVLADRRRGFFHPDRFGFGDAVYLSRLYAAIEDVEGVDSVVVRRFRRFGERDRGELQNGVVEIGPWEIARLDNDVNFKENGVLRITALGGKG